ncbi:nucleoside kinase [Blautia sp. MSJ-19]|uniref:nucleoside kinase n=1 Tax=Blautia sp. MSJ-19 TaxID=2841517 RepID=UPI001C0EF186|nr:nucleoside kinase [Blautia sp. MSJ-19]MBU5482403.1 nucleoside kinase [Blautia sp. MSJ-19]
MDQEMVKVTIDGKEREYALGTSFREIADEYQDDIEAPIILVMTDGKLRELQKKLKGDCTLEFVTTKDHIGFETYKRTVCLVLLRAIYDVAGRKNVDKVMIHYSVGNGYYFTMSGKVTLDQDFLNRVKGQMHLLADMCTPIGKRSVNTDDAVALFHHHRMYDKEKLFRFRRVSKVNIYNIGYYDDYFYGYMADHAGYVKYFDLKLYDEGFVLELPTRKEPSVIPPFCPESKIFRVQKESQEWAEKMDISYVGDLNDRITKEGIGNILLVQEALQEAKISDIAQRIVSEGNKKFIMIAGPSSSGKTSFSHRLSIQLTAHGMKPHPIGVDNYFKNREETPLDEYGEKNYECLEAIDVEQFNKDMLALLNGERVELPVFNFKTGLREYKGDFLQLGPEDVLVIEGIHGLNDKLSYALPAESKFKIYISALTQLNIDEHNRIPTTDGRLIRRIVRDARTRGTSAKDTIARWPSVRRGEEANIFPYQEQADVMFNSALVYELACLKVYAEPLLFGIDKSEPEYLEAKRLLKFLDYFISVPSEDIPHNSLLREFVGGSCFDV